MALNIALIMGSTFTSIFLEDAGVVLREPTIAALTADGKKIAAAGAAAANMQGRTSDKSFLVAPVKNGVIAEPDVAAKLLKQFLSKIYPERRFFKPRVNAIVATPTGINKADIEAYYEVCRNAGITSTVLVPKVMMAAVGMDLPVSAPVSSMVCQMGGGTSDIGVIALSGILSSGAWGLTIGGDMMDRAICDYIAGSYNVKIALSAAQKLKEQIGCLYENDTSFKEVAGVDLSGRPVTLKISAGELTAVLEPYYVRIAEVIETAINGCGPEISSDILRSGIHFTGGSAQIPGLAELLSAKLDLKINVAREPALSSIIGGGKLLKNKELLEEILS